MIREAKGVAIHDLSFWSTTLPLLDGLPRVIREYQITFGRYVPLVLTSQSGRDLHEQTLARMVGQWGSPPAARSWDPAEIMGRSLLELMAERAVSGPPKINESIAGCGSVVGGSCDLLWQPWIVELKLTAKEPGLRDVRQVLVYAGLLYLAVSEAVQFGLVANPRLGVAVEFEINELLLMTGGLDLDGFASRLGDFLVTSAQSN